MVVSWLLLIGTLLALEIGKKILRFLREVMREAFMCEAFIVFRSSCGVQLTLILLLSDCVPFRGAMFEGKRICQKRET
jgi:hypothetical protein